MHLPQAFRVSTRVPTGAYRDRPQSVHRQLSDLGVLPALPVDAHAGGHAWGRVEGHLWRCDTCGTCAYSPDAVLLSCADMTRRGADGRRQKRCPAMHGGRRI